MDAKAQPHSSVVTEFTGADGNELVGEVSEPLGEAVGTALLLHGGGQTRHSWSRTGEALAQAGWKAVLYDQRGHGQSAWDAGGDYSMLAYARDLEAVGQALSGQTGGPLVAVGASLGGIAGMIVAGRLAPQLFQALVLVDVTPEMKLDGVEKILGFMAANASEGFSSLEQAAEAISRYLPHRPKPKDTSGLSKNLRLDADGRYRWHWDPRFLDSRSRSHEHVADVHAELVEAAGRLKVPVLLVRGRESELVGEDEAANFKALVPHARIADVSGARHMVAGDRNDVFATAVLEFLSGLAGRN